MAKKKLTNLELSSLCEDIHERDVNFYSREIYLNRWLEDDDDGIDHKVAARFIKNLHLLERQGRGKIIVHMCLGGGSWQYGTAIYDVIKAAKSLISILVYAEASSMSGIILQAAPRRIMMPHSGFMLHHGSIGFEPVPSNAASEMVKYNDKACKTMLDIFAARAMHGNYFKQNNMSFRKVREFIDDTIRKKGDWYLSAHEACFYGFADCVYGSEGCML